MPADRRRRRRRRLRACLALAVVAALGGAWCLVPDDPLEAGRRRVPLGADRDAVEAAVGKAADGVIGKAGPNGEMTRYECVWQRCYGKAVVQLLVEFDEGDRAVSAEVAYWPGPTPWERFWAWLGW
jgi:hypothetical protein